MSARVAAVVAALLFLGTARAPVAPGCTVPVILLILALGVAGLAALAGMAVWILAGDTGRARQQPPPRGRRRMEAT